ncbi:MAG: rhodanese-like domain-containing protein [Defluviitaleaceae bacterium]|nr:rhodanese-like domain-containing protein [Defluviitaleaceae bacterium]
MKILITARELAENITEYLILDARNREEYEKSHIQGAVHIPGDPLLKEGDDFMSRANFTAMMGRLGITNACKIVVYDDGNGRAPARFWFVAKHYGHGDIFVLDGGWPAAVYLPQSTEEPAPSPADYTTAITPGYIVSTQDILDGLGSIKILDVRTLEEYTGIDLYGNPRGGHIPGAINVSHTKFLDASPARYFIDTDKITSIMDNAGINKKDFIVPC